MSEFRTIGCRLKHGPVMELGIHKSAAGPDYKCAVVLGTDDVPPTLLIGPPDSRYAVTRRVPADLADAWFKAHAKDSRVLDRKVFIIK